MRSTIYACAAAIWVLSVISPFARADDEPDAAGKEFFEKKIRPVLVSKCYKCHAADSKEIKAGLLVDSRDGLRKGGESGPAVVPGSAADSLLLEAIRYESFEMPPDAKLSDEVIADFEKWVEMGAPDPRGGAVVKVQKEIDFEKARQFWAFQPVKNVEPPEVKDAGWTQDAVDQFLQAKREAAGLKPVAEAEPQALLRRLYFDLVGLPPSPEELQRFAAHPTREAYTEIVDRLLDSPQYGERWGRHWLDVARYAESNGRERNFLYPHAWRYRDYVIDAVGADKPFDQFIIEQIAGDLLPAENAAQQNEHLIATGFLAIGAKLLNERNPEIFRMDMVDEQLDVTTRSFMALTVACARCHDHKFDPVPTSEYYAMAGIFRSSTTLYGTGGGGNRQSTKLMTLSAENDPASGMSKADAAKVAELRKELKAAQKEVQQLAGAAKGKAAKNKKQQAKGKAAADRQQLATLRGRIKEINGELEKLGVSAAPGGGDLAMAMQEGNVEDSPLYIRGEVDDPGARVPRGFLTVASCGQEVAVSQEQSGRLELARWIADPANPLTSRVIVNRVWQHVFGRGLVATVDNFGANGEEPTHPELLDYLASEFVRDGWSVKRLIRRLVLTRTYSLSSEFDAAGYEKDPDDYWLWRMPSRRLDAESLRDAMLAASGQLDLSRPEGSPVAALQDTQQYGRGVNVNEESNHRSVYLPICRNGVPQSLVVFDFAEPSILVGTREVTTVPAQALYMLNNDFVIAQSERLARRLLAAEKLDDAGRIDLAYELTFSRPATADERERAIEFLAKLGESMSEGKVQSERSQLSAWTALCQAMFASAEFRYLD